MKVVQPINTGGSYNNIQTVYQLSRFSGLGDNLTGTATSIAQKLGPIIDAALTKNIPSLGVWVRVWGPCVYQTDKDCSGKGRVSNVADNVMYVVHNAQANCYVVGVAGTNGNTDTKHNWYDTDCLDNNVSTLVPFPSGITPTNSTSSNSSNAGNVSLGAAMGTTNLLNMQDPAAGRSLQSFLKVVQSSSATLIFAGHSLGGSLSPTLARWLFTGFGDLAPWGAVYVLPTAAPSTGDQSFADGFSKVFPPTSIAGVSPYGYWNQVIWNQYDVVPHGWTNLMNVLPDNAQNDVVWDYVKDKSIQTLYGPLQGFDANLTYDTINSKYQLLPTPNPYVRLPSQMFTPSPLPPQPSNFMDFLNIVGNQHISAYDAYFGVPATVAQAKVSLMSPGPDAKERPADLRNTA
ncbi:lipase family protein [Myxococcus landrumensis]|uniref:Fungal lipase-type domain-containing protein n=1 Tax=Myxococcus landrumensis TaxID=2813577 RepID=A0ABX7NAM7_9BACT|nr:hypothetical protein [Myxococcus landrumus]QSQ15708.1 hypothetical protein JY572_06485 [Myxococcus landrumus]